jgi:catechol 2,3-dioxygenase-like lactoylglutathione lyase family enzyme
MDVKKFDSVCIWSENPDELAKFYENVFGRKPDGRLDIPDDQGTWFLIGEDKVQFFIGYHDKVHGKSAEPYRIMPGFVVDSVDKVYAELKPKGVKFITRPCPSPDSTYRVATIEDPEGNLIQFFSDYK